MLGLVFEQGKNDKHKGQPLRIRHLHPYQGGDEQRPAIVYFSFFVSAVEIPGQDNHDDYGAREVGNTELAGSDQYIQKTGHGKKTQNNPQQVNEPVMLVFKHDNVLVNHPGWQAVVLWIACHQQITQLPQNMGAYIGIPVIFPYAYFIQVETNEFAAALNDLF